MLSLCAKLLSTNKCRALKINYHRNNNVGLSLRQKYSQDCKSKNLQLQNPNIAKMKSDFLYHLGLGTAINDLPKMFGDVKFVCMGGTPQRMRSFAYFIMKEIDHKLPTGTKLLDITAAAHRYAMYKVGPVLCVNHHMGIPTVSILMHELIKLMYHAKCIDPIFIRIGTCGGLGVEGGTIIITKEAVDAKMRPSNEFVILGKSYHRPAKLDNELAKELKGLHRKDDPYETVIGKTMCTNDFYEGQARLDGAFCTFSESDKMAYLEKLRCHDIVNMEMESSIFAAMTHHAGIKAAVVCVALLNRLNGDQIDTPKDVMMEWQDRPQKLVARLIRKRLGIKDKQKKCKK